MSFLDSVGSFLEKTSPITTPFARRFAYGAERGSEIELEEERARIGTLNGSGPLDREGAIYDAARRDGSRGLGLPAGGPPPWMIAAGVGAVIVFALIFRRR
jgi:hypothetical protein